MGISPDPAGVSSCEMHTCVVNTIAYIYPVFSSPPAVPFPRNFKCYICCYTLEA